MSIIDWQRLSRVSASPGEAPHLIVDDFLDPTWIETVGLYTTVRDLGRSPRLAAFRSFNTRSAATEGRDALPPPIRDLIDALHAPRFLRWLEAATGIEGLRGDEALANGGLHYMAAGGYLRLHRDEEIHPDAPRLRRRLNLMLYLNDRWREAYGGHLEIWSRDAARRVARIEPRPNRCVVTLIGDNTHGIPEPLACPIDEARSALILWFYTEERDAVPFRPAVFVPRRGDSVLTQTIIAAESRAFGAYHRLRRSFARGAAAARAVMGLIGYGRTTRR